MSATDPTQAQDGPPNNVTATGESRADRSASRPESRPSTQSAAPDKALTISRRRLAGSPSCLNCGTELKGPFCYYCGQPDKNLLRFFPVLVRDLLEDVMDFDSRFMRTMRPLLFHPGRLTRDYLDGRRFRYVPPMRLYIFSSMLFFILAATVAGNAIDVVRGTDGAPPAIHIGGHTENTAENTAEDGAEDGAEAAADAGSPKTEFETELNAALGEAVAEGALSKELAGEISDAVHERTGADHPAAAADESSAPDEEQNIMFNGERWDRETNPLVIPGVPKFLNDWLNDEIGESPEKSREIEENPNLIVDKLFDVMPVAVFVMLPLVAMLLKFWYLFAGKYYVEHLIHALHNHSFLFVVFILTSVSDGIAMWLDPQEVGRPSQISSWLTIILLCWVPLYLLISLKTVYRQGWFMTFMKFSLLGVSYLVLLALVTSVAALAGFVLL